MAADLDAVSFSVWAKAGLSIVATIHLHLTLNVFQIRILGGQR